MCATVTLTLVPHTAHLFSDISATCLLIAVPRTESLLTDEVLNNSILYWLLKVIAMKASVLSKPKTA